MTTGETTSNGDSVSLWKLLFGIVDRPRSTFESVLARRGTWLWLAPLLILLLCFSVMVAVQAPHNVELAQQQAQQRLDSMPAEQAEAAAAQMETFISLPFLLATGLGFGAILLLIIIAVQAVILYFGTLIVGGDVNFGPMFTVSIWSRLPYAISYLALAGYMAIAGRAVRYPGLSTLVATGDLMKDSGNPLVTVLGAIDLFWLWHLFLVVVGLSVIARYSRSKSVGLTVVYAALSLALMAVPALLVGGQG